MNSKERHEELKTILDEAMQEFPEMQVPPGFTDALIHKLETRLTWHELITEFALKTGLIIAALAILALVLFFPGKDIELSMFSYLIKNWYIVAASAFIFFFTFFFDQVFLRFLFRKNRS